ncbi:MAG: hypothetical protein A2167_02015 [Planctomycetes bacterium RBG_13_46_10]|nr:MAG: hypothetical protein A2167_02015 [Planctomycetes bacterium RBG_13_46_10]
MVRRYHFPVEPIIRANGNCPSQEFYDNLDRPVKAKFIAIFRRIEKSTDGTLRDTDKLEKLKGGHTCDLWEMKVRHKGVWYRMLCFRDGPAWMLTHGFKKNRNNTPISEIQKGCDIKQEYNEIKRQNMYRR